MPSKMEKSIESVFGSSSISGTLKTLKLFGELSTARLKRRPKRSRMVP